MHSAVTYQALDLAAFDIPARSWLRHKERSSRSRSSLRLVYDCDSSVLLDKLQAKIRTRSRSSSKRNVTMLTIPLCIPACHWCRPPWGRSDSCRAQRSILGLIRGSPTPQSGIVVSVCMFAWTYSLCACVVAFLHYLGPIFARAVS